MKIQYPGVADSIESDIENVRLLLTYTNLIPKGLFLDRAMKVNFFIHYVSRDMDGSHCFFFHRISACGFGTLLLYLFFLSKLYILCKWTEL